VIGAGSHSENRREGALVLDLRGLDNRRNGGHRRCTYAHGEVKLHAAADDGAAQSEGIRNFLNSMGKKFGFGLARHLLAGLADKPANGSDHLRTHLSTARLRRAGRRI
jgi:hypothetical protein